MNQRPALILLGLGAFAVGTDGFIISGVLPDIAGTLAVSTATAGQLIAVFTIVFAVAAPILAAVTSRLSRRTLLTASMVVFVVANLLGAAAGAYWVMVVARVIAALGAAAFIGPAVAVATSVVSAEYRGRAYSYVAGGISLATALGLPLGTLIGTLTSWRVTLVLVAVVALVAVVGLRAALPADLPLPPALGLADRLRVGVRPLVLLALAANLFVAAGAYGVFTYIVPMATTLTPLSGPGITLVLLAWGLTGIGANVLGGRWNDRFGPHRVYLVATVALCVVLVAFVLAGSLLTGRTVADAVVFVVLVVALGVVAWGLQPAQANRLIDFVPEAPPVVVALGNSATYVGISLGSVLGGVVISRSSVTALAWPALGAAVLAVVFVLVARRPRAAQEVPEASDAPSP